MGGKVEAFRQYGVTLKNDRWSWSGRTPAGEVVAALWRHEFNDPDDLDIYRPDGKKLSLWRGKLGNKHRIKDFIHAQETAGGCFRLVLLEAKDPLAEPKRVNIATARKDLVMKLDEFDEKSGLFLAHVMRSP